MRFSRDQQSHQFDASHARGRRRAKLLGDLKAEIRAAASGRGINLAALARLLRVHKSVVSRALDPARNIEVFTLFDLAEALGKEWSFKLHDHRISLDAIITPQQIETSSPIPTVNAHIKGSHDAPVVGTSRNAAVQTVLLPFLREVT